ncbi:MAG: MGMT family protein [Candidatus Saccharibacteria bacterium]
MSRVDADFAQRVYAYVEQIPKGKVMTYGQLAALSGAAWAAWEVGQIANRGPVHLPWHRVVNKQGGLARGWPNGGLDGHKAVLEADGYHVNDDYTVNVSELLWNPQQTTLL